MRIHLSILTVVSFFIIISACKHEVPPVIDPAVIPTDGNFPPEVAKIFLNKCATAGCHNAQSYKNAGSLQLDTWDHLFNGGSNGASVVAYSPENSPLLYFINPDSAANHQPAATPTMPYNSAPLSMNEYNTIRNWIAAGAPDKNGNIPFASNPETRQKTYIVNKGCDVLAVVDNERNVVMRYINVGIKSTYEFPHTVRVSNDGRYAYVDFEQSNCIQKIDTRTDAVIATANLNVTPTLASLTLSDDDSKLIACIWQNIGGLVLVGTNNMQEITHYDGFSFPHGIMATQSFDTFYITPLKGNYIIRLSPKTGDKDEIVMDNSGTNYNNTYDAHELIMRPDRAVYFATCEYSNEVRVMNAQTDKFIKAIPVGLFPQELAVSRSKPYLFVTCMRDNSPIAGAVGSVYVINYNTLDIVKRIDGNFYAPHGITVDDKNGTFTIVSQGSNVGHHETFYGGYPGWYQIYSLQRLEPTQTKRFELLLTPYSADTRFKQ